MTKSKLPWELKIHDFGITLRSLLNKQTALSEQGGIFLKDSYIIEEHATPPNSEIICGQNVSTKVVCGIFLFFEKKAMLKI